MLTELLKPQPTDEVALWAFLRSLSASRLLPEDDVELLRRQFSAAKINVLFDMLLGEEMLTPYQLKRIRDGKGRGLVLGQYHILDELGQGGFGQVFKARHAIMDRLVALKLISNEWVQEPEIRKLFVRETMASTRLVHPNIALAYDANEIDGELFLAMEFVDGPTLDKYVTQSGPLPFRLARAIIRQTALALQAAHDAGMVHRDIKPANIMLPGVITSETASPTNGPPALVKIVDFGLARLYPHGTRQSATLFCKEGDVVGSPAYMSPEQLRNVHGVDIRADLYSLGCTFYYALTGRAPFQGSTTQQTFAMHQESDPLPIENYRPDVPPELCAIVRRLMAKNPDDRYQSPAEVADVLSSPRLPVRIEEQPESPVSHGIVPEPEPEPAPLPQPFQAWQPLPEPEPYQEPYLEPEEPPAPTIDGTDEEHALGDTVVTLQPATSRLPIATPEPAAAPLADVGRLWGQWRLAFDGVPPVPDREYRARHRALMEALRGEQPADATSGLYERALSVAEPWLSLAALASLEARSLAGLRRDCARLDAEFGPPVPPTGNATWLVALAFAVALGAAFYWFRVMAH